MLPDPASGRVFHVVTGDGEPLAESVAHVAASTDRELPPTLVPWHADAAGRIVLPNDLELRTEEVLVFRAPGHLSAVSAATTGGRVVLHRSAVLQGCARLATGDGVPGLAVSLSRVHLTLDLAQPERNHPGAMPGPGHAAVFRAVSDARGRFAIDGLAPGTWWMRLAHPDLGVVQHSAGEGMAVVVPGPEIEVLLAQYFVGRLVVAGEGSLAMVGMERPPWCTDHATYDDSVELLRRRHPALRTALPARDAVFLCLPDPRRLPAAVVGRVWADTMDGARHEVRVAMAPWNGSAEALVETILPLDAHVGRAAGGQVRAALTDQAGALVRCEIDWLRTDREGPGPPLVFASDSGRPQAMPRGRYQVAPADAFWAQVTGSTAVVVEGGGAAASMLEVSWRLPMRVCEVRFVSAEAGRCGGRLIVTGRVSVPGPSGDVLPFRRALTVEPGAPCGMQLPPGSYEVRAIVGGFESAQASFEVRGAEVEHIQVMLPTMVPDGRR